jgi:hypothetical protein
MNDNASVDDNAEMPRLRLMLIRMLIVRPLIIVILLIMLPMQKIGQRREGDML